MASACVVNHAQPSKSARHFVPKVWQGTTSWSMALLAGGSPDGSACGSRLVPRLVRESAHACAGRLGRLASTGKGEIMKNLDLAEEDDTIPARQPGAAPC